MLQHTPSIPHQKTSSSIDRDHCLLAVLPKPEVWVTRWRSVIGRQASSWTLPLATWGKLQSEDQLHLQTLVTSCCLQQACPAFMWRKAGMYLWTGSSKPSLPSCTVSDSPMPYPCFHGLPPWVRRLPNCHCNALVQSFHPSSLKVEPCSCSIDLPQRHQCHCCDRLPAKARVQHIAVQSATRLLKPKMLT